MKPRGRNLRRSTRGRGRTKVIARDGPARSVVAWPIRRSRTTPLRWPRIRRHDFLYRQIGNKFYLTAIASRTKGASSSGLSTGGRQVKLVHTTATDLFSLSAGRLGMVSASAGGRLVATASL